MRKEEGEGQEGRSGERHLLSNSIAHVPYCVGACCSDPPSGGRQEESVDSQWKGSLTDAFVIWMMHMHIHWGLQPTSCHREQIPTAVILRAIQIQALLEGLLLLCQGTAILKPPHVSSWFCRLWRAFSARSQKQTLLTLSHPLLSCLSCLW